MWQIVKAMVQWCVLKKREHVLFYALLYEFSAAYQHLKQQADQNHRTRKKVFGWATLVSVGVGIAAHWMSQFASPEQLFMIRAMGAFGLAMAIPLLTVMLISKLVQTLLHQGTDNQLKQTISQYFMAGQIIIFVVVCIECVRVLGTSITESGGDSTLITLLPACSSFLALFVCIMILGVAMQEFWFTDQKLHLEMAEVETEAGTPGTDLHREVSEIMLAHREKFWLDKMVPHKKGAGHLWVRGEVEKPKRRSL